MSPAIVTAALCVGVIALNLLATSAVLRNQPTIDARRMAMLVAIWLLPGLGAIVVLLMRPAGSPDTPGN
jgi:hypothetical protein